MQAIFLIEQLCFKRLSCFRFQKECFTRVLKGQIRLATAKFPNKCVGSRLDSIARLALWEVGLDYKHGTGHGVGSYLNVHEGTLRNRPTTKGPLSKCEELNTFCRSHWHQLSTLSG